ncbi:MAG: hypothetical protein HQM16_02515 [Deltaproteobacteria bacterium]|nr:hypothetical protein [Deltaproteobacteria bacterium]
MLPTTPRVLTVQTMQTPSALIQAVKSTFTDLPDAPVMTPHQTAEFERLGHALTSQGATKHGMALVRACSNTAAASPVEYTKQIVRAVEALSNVETPAFTLGGVALAKAGEVYGLRPERQADPTSTELTQQLDTGLITETLDVDIGHDTGSEKLEKPEPVFYPHNTTPKEESAVALDQATLARARTNMAEAMTALANESPMLPAMLPLHLSALIMGEINANVDLRTEAVSFIAESVYNATIYGAAVIANVVDTGRFHLPLTTIPVTWSSRVADEAPQVADAIVNGIENVQNILRIIRSLRVAYPEAMASLATANPGAFGPEALRELGNIYQLHELAATHPAQDLVDFILAGDIPVRFVSLGEDHELIKVRAPRSDGQPVNSTPSDWADPVSNFLQRADWTDYVRTFDIKEFIADSMPTASQAEQKVLIHVRELDYQSNQSRAFEILLSKILLPRLKEEVTSLNTWGITQFDIVPAMIEAMIGRGEYQQALVLYNFTHSRLQEISNAVNRIEYHQERLFLIGERKARNKFLALARRMIRDGNLEAAQRLSRSMARQGRGREPVVRIKQGALSKQLSSVVAFIAESMRSLGALPAGEATLSLASSVPSTASLMDFRKFDPRLSVADYLALFGIPAPGSKDVPALGVSGATGFRAGKRQ